MSPRRAQQLRAAIAARDPQDPALAAWLAPEYPRASLSQACALRQGQSPLSLARREGADEAFTRREAHQWLSESPATPPLTWFASQLGGVGSLRSWTVARWVAAVRRRPAEWSALLRDREFPGPAGQRATGRFLDRLDEVQDEDLVEGTRTGVVRAFERAAERLGEAYLSRLGRDHRELAPEPVWRVPRAGSRAMPTARWLRTPAALVREGREMHHCVGGYSCAVEAGSCHILAVNVCGERGTAEMSADGRVLQWFGRSDQRPPERATRWLNRWLRRRGLEPVGTRWGRL